MGARANFVIIRNGIAEAYYDHWAALGCLLLFAEGPEKALQALEITDKTNELMERAWAEGGYLVDFDHHTAIVFGYQDITGLSEEDFIKMGKDEADKSRAVHSAFEKGPLNYLKYIAPHWKGWLLLWDNRGVDRFSEYLQQRNISTIRWQPASSPPSQLKLAEYQA